MISVLESAAMIWDMTPGTCRMWREGVRLLSALPGKLHSEAEWSCKSRSTTATSFFHAYVCIGLCLHLVSAFSSSLAGPALRWAYSNGRGCSLRALG